ncbi:MAG: 2Fe-2S iron-sulfur cluster binding domain-containing protein [Deltaproteobacteria bacterium]|nr:2Fe-2S iron-sulfur cluster binding domain-containing protein [Deltaproteobacteria bacterium]
MTELVLGIFLVSGGGALLAFLLEMAHKYLADYGQVEININGQKVLEVEGGSPLLSTLAQQNIFVPSACGGKGTCAACKVRVLEGGGPVLPTESPYLSPEELEGRVRLSCQVKVRNALAIEIPEELFLVREFKVRVESIDDLTPRIKGITFHVLEPAEGITFKPGQYVQLEVPRYEKSAAPEFRAYSLASGAHEGRRMDLYITKVEEGVVSTYVHEKLQVGEVLTARGPFGDFFYRHTDRDLLLIATGSGLAPIRSICLHLEQIQADRQVTMFFGARDEEDLFNHEELQQLRERLPNFTYVPVLSRVPEDSPWDGERGRVTDLIKKHIPDGAELDVYICGAPPMVESCEDLLVKKGISPANIYYDKFA